MKHYTSIILSIIFSMGIYGCGGSDSNANSGNTTTMGGEFNIEGYAQKGPFQPGSVVTIQELDSNLEQTGVGFTTQIANYDGYYDVSANLNTSLVEVFADGYFYNEIEQTSGEILSISAFVDLNKESNVNLNIVTALIKDAVKKFYEQGLTFDEANAKATEKLLELYGYNTNGNTVDNFYKTSLQDQGDYSAMLLAISALTLEMSEQNDVPLTTQIRQIATVLADQVDASVNEMKARILRAHTTVVPNQVYENTVNYFLKYGMSYEATHLLFFIDNDGDGAFVDKQKPVFITGGSSVNIAMPSATVEYTYDAPIEAFDYQGREMTYIVQSMPKYGEVQLVNNNGSWTANYSWNVTPSDSDIMDCFTVNTELPATASNTHQTCIYFQAR